jgi:hypothetical protein
MNPTTLQPWDQQPGETGLAYAAFRFYRDLGPTRTLDAAYNAQQATKKPRPDAPADTGQKTASGGFRVMAIKWRWVERVRAWDAHVDKARQDAVLEKARQAATVSDTEWAVRRLQQRQTEWKMREALLAKAEAMLSFPLATKEAETVEQSPDGMTVRRVTIWRPAKWTMQTALEAIKLAAELGRLATNMKPKPEDAAPAMEDVMFDSSGELEEALPTGVAPVMPDDPFAKPDIGQAAGHGSNPHGLHRVKKQRPPGG